MPISTDHKLLSLIMAILLSSRLIPFTPLLSAHAHQPLPIGAIGIRRIECSGSGFAACAAPGGAGRAGSRRDRSSERRGEVRGSGVRGPGSRIQVGARRGWLRVPSLEFLSRRRSHRPPGKGRSGAGVRPAGGRTYRQTSRPPGSRWRCPGLWRVVGVSSCRGWGSERPGRRRCLPCVLCPQAGSQAPPRMDIRPNHTIYINNINDKIKKEGTSVCRSPLEWGGCPVRPGDALAHGTCLTKGLPEVSQVPSRR